MKFFDDKCKNSTSYNRNYFYLGTVIVIALNLIIFCGFGNNWQSSIVGEVSWDSGFSLINLVRAICNTLSHMNWLHVIGNMLITFPFLAIYIERKTGTLKFLLLILCMMLLSSSVTCCADGGVNWHGFSVVIWACFGYVVIDYLFSFNKIKRNKTNIILGAIVILYFLGASFVDFDINSNLQFYFYPYQLWHNLGHSSGFIAGIVICLIINISQLSFLKNKYVMLNYNSTNYKADSSNNATKSGFQKTKSIMSILLIFVMVAYTTILCVAMSNGDREVTTTFNFVCANDELYSSTFDVKQVGKPDKTLITGTYNENVNANAYFELYLDKEFTKPVKFSDWSKKIMSDVYYNSSVILPYFTKTNYSAYLKKVNVYDITIEDFDWCHVSLNNAFDRANIYYSSNFLFTSLYNKYIEGEDATFYITCGNYEYNVVVKINGEVVTKSDDDLYHIKDYHENIHISLEYV